MKDLSNIIRKFENLPYKSHDRNRPKHELTDSYIYLARQLVKYMVRDDALKPYIYPVRTEMTDTKKIPIPHIGSTDESIPKESLVDKNYRRSVLHMSTNQRNNR